MSIAESSKRESHRDRPITLSILPRFPGPRFSASQANDIPMTLSPMSRLILSSFLCRFENWRAIQDCGNGAKFNTPAKLAEHHPKNGAGLCLGQLEKCHIRSNRIPD
jgi:hypothetical protein